ncbi:MAG: ATP-binding protein [Nocardiopsaceae bacterium]|nr:ATP-binding protein [Nocardiopsaceae bacterium]
MTGRFTGSSPTWVKCGCFAGSLDQVAAARAWVRMVLCDYGDDLVADAELCVSELVTNAVTHTRSTWAGGVVWVRVEFHPDHLRITVRDNGSDEVPTVGGAGIDAEGGRGLALVEYLADSFGHRGNYLGREVWCTFAGTPGA